MEAAGYQLAARDLAASLDLFCTRTPTLALPLIRENLLELPAPSQYDWTHCPRLKSYVRLCEPEAAPNNSIELKA